MRRKAVFLAAGILVVSLLAYAWLGGFSSLEYELVTLPELSISGTEFTGRPTQKELEEIFYHYRDIALRQDTSLIVVTYPKKEETANIRQFIGLPELKLDSAEIRTWQNGEFIRVVLALNLVVTPKPEAVMEKAGEFAASKNRTITGESIEIYYPEKDAVVLFPLKPID